MDFQCSQWPEFGESVPGVGQGSATCQAPACAHVHNDERDQSKPAANTSKSMASTAIAATTPDPSGRLVPAQPAIKVRAPASHGFGTQIYSSRDRPGNAAKRTSVTNKGADTKWAGEARKWSLPKSEEGAGTCSDRMTSTTVMAKPVRPSHGAAAVAGANASIKAIDAAAHTLQAVCSVSTQDRVHATRQCRVPRYRPDRVHVACRCK